MALVSDGSSAGEQGSEGAVGQGDGVGLDDDVAMQFGMAVEVGLRVVLVRVEVDRITEGIGQGPQQSVCAITTTAVAGCHRARQEAGIQRRKLQDS